MNRNRLFRAVAVAAACLVALGAFTPSASANDAVRRAHIDTVESVGGYQIHYDGVAQQVTSTTTVGPAVPQSGVAFACSFQALSPDLPHVQYKCYIETRTGGYYPGQLLFGQGFLGAYAAGAWYFLDPTDMRFCMQATVSLASTVDGPLRCVPVAV